MGYGPLAHFKGPSSFWARINPAPREHSAILSTFIRLPFVFKTIVLSVFECLLKTAFTVRERSGSVVECLTQDRRAVGSSLTGVTALCP